MSSRKDELLAAAREQLANEKNARANGLSAADSGPEIRYRGQVLRQSGGAVPGSGLGNRPSSGGGDGDVKAALAKVKELYQEGLISRAEAEKKRSEILGRL